MVVHFAFSLGPVLAAACADKDKRHAVLRRLRVVDSLVIAAVGARDILTALESWIFDTLRIDLQVLSTHCEISTVHAVVDLTMLGCSLIVVTQLAFKLEEASVI